MYETLAMIKPGEVFAPEEMASIVSEIANSGEAQFERRGDSCVIQAGDSYLEIGYSTAAHIKEESQEIASEFGLACGECTVRYEIAGDDLDMLLFNDYLLLNERLYKTGKFVIFNQVECEEFTV